MIQLIFTTTTPGLTPIQIHYIMRLKAICTTPQSPFYRWYSYRCYHSHSWVVYDFVLPTVMDSWKWMVSMGFSKSANGPSDNYHTIGAA